MGWDFAQGYKKKDVIADLTRGWESETSKCACLQSCVRGNVLWAVMETTNKVTGQVAKWIACNLLGAEKGFGWGSKNMSEAEFPYYFSCPLGYLDLVPVECAEWRGKVREYHAGRRKAA